MQICPRCQSPNEESHRFCAFCGTSLAAAGPGPHEIRFASALFVDIVASTLLTESHDPEVVRALVSRVFARLKNAIRRHGGVIEKTIGDGLLSIFGAPVSHEDHAERAVRAALEMRAAMSELNRIFAKEGRPTLQIRTGIESGDILADMDRVRDGSDAMVTGDAVNISARLQGAARPGGILVGPEAHRLTEHKIEYEPPQELRLKGKTRPLTAAEPISIKARLLSRRLPVRYDTELIGRETELSVLTKLVKDQASASRPQVALIVGAAGIGKSRLVSEVKAQARDLDQTLYWREGACLAYGDVPFAPIVDIFRAQFELKDGATDVDIRRALEELFTEGDAPIEETKVLISPSETGPSREELFDSWRDILERMAARYPLVLVIEDVHWADEGTLAFIDYLSDWAEAPILLILASRPEVYEKYPVWQGPRANRTTIHLDPLTHEQTRRLIRELIEDDLPSKVEEDLLTRCGGSPLFAEEIAHHMQTSTADPAETTAQIPRTLQSLISARLDGLPPILKPVVQNAAVIGPIFTVQALQHLMEKSGDEMRALLDDLVSLGIVTYKDSRDSLSFHHVLVRDVAYSTLPKSTRADLHAKIGAWIEGQPSSRDASEILAAHFTLAATYLAELGNLDSVAPDVAEKAYRLSVVAAERARSLWQPVNAARWLEEALKWSEHIALPERELAYVWESLGKACRHARSVDQTVAAFREALDIRSRLGSQIEVGKIEAHLAEVVFESADDEKVIEWTDRAIEHLSGHGNSAELAGALHVRGRFLWRRDMLDEAEPFLTRALEIARVVGDRVIEGHASLTLGSLQLWSTGDPASGAELIRNGYEISKGAGDLELRLRACNNLAVWLLDQDVGPKEIEPLYKEGVETGSKAGDILNTTWLMGGYAGFLRTWGRLEEAETVAVRGMEMARSIGSVPAMALNLVIYRDIKLLRGELDEIDRVKPELDKLMTQNPEKQLEKNQVVQDALVAIARGKQDEGLQLLEAGIRELVPSAENIVMNDQMLLETTRQLMRAGRKVEAVDVAGRLRQFADKASFTAMFSDWAAGLVDNEPRRATRRLEKAAGRAQQRELIVFEARILIDLAEAQARSGLDPQKTLDRARSLLETSGARFYLPELERVEAGAMTGGAKA